MIYDAKVGKSRQEFVSMCLMIKTLITSIKVAASLIAGGYTSETVGISHDITMK